MFAWACERFFVFADSPVRAYDPACKHRNVICNAAVILLYLHTTDKETCVPMSVALSRASVVQGVNEIIHRSENSFAYLFMKEIVKTDVVVPPLLPVSSCGSPRAGIG
jgi:hypothetical protein